MKKIEIQWKDKYEGSCVGLVDGQEVVFVSKRGDGLVWVSFIGFEGLEPWDKNVHTIAGGKRLGEIMIKGSKGAEDIESVYLDHVEKIDDLDAYEARTKKE